MAARGVAGFDAGYFEGNDLIIQQGHDPADGADEFNAALAGPIHGLGEMYTSDELGKFFTPYVSDLSSLYEFSKDIAFALFIGHLAKLAYRCILLARKSFGGFFA